MNRKELEDAGLLYQINNSKEHLLVLKTKVFMTRKEREQLRLELQAEADRPVLLLPACVDVASRRGRWIDKKDHEYSGGGYTACSVCGQRYSWGAYHEPQEFRHCPRCGHQMEVEEDERLENKSN